MTKLIDICDIQYGYAFDSACFTEDDSYLPLVRIRDVKRGFSETFYSGEYPEEYVIHKGDLIVGMDGEFNIARWKSIDALLNQRVCKLKAKEGTNEEYLRFALVKALKTIEDKTAFVTVKHLSAKELNKLELDMPGIEEQNVRAESMAKLEKVISHRKEELSALDNLIKARFVELFECGDHEIVKASDVCDFITKGTTPPTGEITEEYENGKIPFLKVYNLSFTGEMLFDENPQYILAETHNGKLARSKVYPNDVLMNIVGPPLGKFTLVTDEFEEWNINQAIAIFRAKERILPRFLLHALMQPKVLEPFIGQAVGIRQQNLSLEQCRNLQFPLPSLEEQKSFVEFAEQLDKSKVAVQKALDETQMLFDSLMQKYFA